ncbi:alpha/beta hydrolase [Panacibacter sp. DH6]|uniref:Alpha/beta hydrolase n=1 Tax=Panacibacter microcysteis TaxID=2793269 RepID=A0A931GYA8_9BACT|nr:alpha/beta hydrolase [Panacibacter microcysteis]MBG9375072.1 alpha/beta hydrolase [Panacibacter microcysteis]
MHSGSAIAYTKLNAKGTQKPYPVIYLHGGPGGHYSNDNIATLQVLADSGYTVYLYDQVGGGNSSRLEHIRDYTVQRHIAELEEVIEKTGAEKVILIGQSWGAILGTLYLVDHSDKVDKIILTCPGPIYPYNDRAVKEKIPDSLHFKTPHYSNKDGNILAANLRTDAMAFMATNFGKKLAGDAEADAFAAYSNALVNRSCVCDTANISKLNREAGNGYYAQLMTYLNLTKITDKRNIFRNTGTKMLVMKGACDNQPWDATNEYLALFKNSRLMFIPGAGHFIFIEQPQLYTSYILGFLNE